MNWESEERNISFVRIGNARIDISTILYYTVLPITLTIVIYIKISNNELHHINVTIPKEKEFNSAVERLDNILGVN